MSSTRNQGEQLRSRAKNRPPAQPATSQERVTTISLNLRGNKARSARNAQTSPSYLVDLRIHKPQALGAIAAHGMDQALALINLARAKELDVIAVTDFYDIRFAEEVRRKNSSKLQVLPGFMLRARIGACDDVLLCAIFSPETTERKLQACLKALGVDQQAGNENFVLPQNLRLAVQTLEKHGALCFPSKMDRTPLRQSCVQTLVEDLGFRTFDLSFNESKSWFRKRWPKLSFNFFRFSAARTLAQAGNKAARVRLDKLGWAGIRDVLRRER